MATVTTPPLLSVAPGNCDPVVFSRWQTASEIVNFEYESGRRRGHYLNSPSELGSGVLDLIGTHCDRLEQADAGV
jgi:hypothetical protein